MGWHTNLEHRYWAGYLNYWKLHIQPRPVARYHHLKIPRILLFSETPLKFHYYIIYDNVWHE